MSCSLWSQDLTQFLWLSYIKKLINVMFKSLIRAFSKVLGSSICTLLGEIFFFIHYLGDIMNTLPNEGAETT